VDPIAAIVTGAIRPIDRLTLSGYEPEASRLACFHSQPRRVAPMRLITPLANRSEPFRVSTTALPAPRPASDDPRPAGRSQNRSSEATVPGFAALGLPADLVAVLTKQGILTPFPIQSLTIADVLAGRDVSGKAQTGSGKTLAFGLPMVARTTTARKRRPHSLVLVPTRELANQVADELAPFAGARGLWLTAIYGGASMVRQIRALQAGVDIVIATPGRLNDLLAQGEMSVADVQFVVLDEADQMADMGFVPQVERILEQIEGRPQTLLFSATLDGAVGALSRRYQQDPVLREVAPTVASMEALEQRFIGVSQAERAAVTARICGAARRALVFVSTTHGADRLVTLLQGEGLRTAAIHGRLSQNKRERVLAAFIGGSVPVLVATNVAARGIHVDAVGVVVHYDPPEDGKVYLHRSGRTARAGSDGLVVTLAIPEHERELTRLMQEIGVDQDIVNMRPDDPRLLDLAAWQPPRSSVPALGGTYSMTPTRRATRPRGAGDGGRGRGAPAAGPQRPAQRRRGRETRRPAW
jgi:superfamily II DNA/RNA helicase